MEVFSKFLAPEKDLLLHRPFRVDDLFASNLVADDASRVSLEALEDTESNLGKALLTVFLFLQGRALYGGFDLGAPVLELVRGAIVVWHPRRIHGELAAVHPKRVEAVHISASRRHCGWYSTQDLSVLIWE